VEEYSDVKYRLYSMEKQKKQKRMQVMGKEYPPMPVQTLRKDWLAKGYELVDITQLCSFRLGNSGWCNDFNEPDENIYHLKIIYRDEEVSVVNGMWCEEGYIFFKEDDGDFIIFKKCKMEKK